MSTLKLFGYNTKISTIIIILILLITEINIIHSRGHTEYYDILGVSPQATAKEIKKAYHRRSLQYHPDKNPDDEEAHQKLIEVNKAYEVLSNEETRTIYDRHGEEGIQQHNKKGAGGGGFDPFQFFGFPHQQQHQQNEEKKGPSVVTSIYLTLEDLYKGRVYEISMLKQSLCPHCFGKGAESDDDIVTCNKCQGSGTIIERKQIGIGFVQQVQKTCPVCNGQGKTVKRKCHVCHGSGLSQGTSHLYLDIHAGTPNHHQIMLDDENDEFVDAKSGDLVFKIETLPHHQFIRDEQNIHNLHITLNISLIQALLGYNIDIVHLDKHIVNINTIKDKIVTKPNDIKIVKKQGMPILHSFPRDYGDLVIHFNIIFPKQLTSQQQQGLKQLGLA